MASDNSTWSEFVLLFQENWIPFTYSAFYSKVLFSCICMHPTWNWWFQRHRGVDFITRKSNANSQYVSVCRLLLFFVFECAKLGMWFVVIQQLSWVDISEIKDYSLKTHILLYFQSCLRTRAPTKQDFVCKLETSFQCTRSYELSPPPSV